MTHDTRLAKLVPASCVGTNTNPGQKSGDVVVQGGEALVGGPDDNS